MRKILFVGLFLCFSFLVFFKQEAYAFPPTPGCSAAGGVGCFQTCNATAPNLGKLCLVPFLDCCGPVPPPPAGGSAACASLPCTPLPAGCKSGDVGFDQTEKGKCEACVKTNQIYTALGCVYTKPEDFVGQLLGWVMGIGGGLAFLLIIYGGFQIVTSTGDPEKLNAGKEIIVSALTGLLMIIFSVILLRIIGVDILQIPGFSK